MDRKNFSDVFKRITQIIDLIDKTSDCDTSLTGELRELFMQTSFSIHYIEPRLKTKNLPYFLMKVDELISRGEGNKYGACFFNIRGFNSINRKIGYDKGTMVMARFFNGLQSSLHKDEIVSAVGGDNGVVLFRTIHQDFVEDYLKETHVVYNDDTGESIAIQTVAGINPNLETCSDHTDVMNSISPAMNVAKKNKGLTFVYYDDRLKNQMANKSRIEQMFHNAIKNKSFEVFYQPKILLSDYSLAGAEALCRWNIDGKLMTPDNFIGILEQSQFIFEFDFYILEKVCKDLREWIDSGKKVRQISLNFSQSNLVNDNLARDIVKRIDSYKIPHSLIQIEITETSNAISNIALKNLVIKLRDEGLSVALDDFGTSFSSLNLIRKLPWNVIKIDPTILKEKEQGEGQTAKLLEMIVSMTQSIGIDCVAEGVESIEDIKLLNSVNCSMAQGYYFDFPMPKAEFETKLV